MRDHLAEEKKRLSKTLKFIRASIDALDTEGRMRGEKVRGEMKFMWSELPNAVRNFDDAVTLAAQNLEIQSRTDSYDRTLLRLNVLKKMLQSPYFGRIDFRPDGAQTQKIYIGPANLMDEGDYSMLVCDWRAPVASLFYENGTGKTSYESPDGTVWGDVELLRQFRIEKGRLVLCIDPELRINDEILLCALSSNASPRMKTIVSTIQREQNSVIRDAENSVLLVTGPAGSGKTSIALHRIAYLLYKDRDRLKSRNILIFSPNEIFSDYISEVIPELGEPNVLQTTFKDMIANYIGKTTGGFFEQTEFLTRSSGREKDRLRREWIRIKGSHEFSELICRFAAGYAPDFADVTFNGAMIYSGAEQLAFFSANGHMTILSRLELIRDETAERLAPHKKAYRDEIAREISVIYSDRAQLDIKTRLAFDEAARETLGAIARNTAADFEKIYLRALAFAGKKLIPSPVERAALLDFAHRELEAGRLYYEDGIALLLLKTLFGAAPPRRDIRHIVIDEAQDYTPAQHEIFSRIFPEGRFTLLGDMSQLLNPFTGMEDPQALLGIYKGGPRCLKTLTKSYRSTVEINEFAAGVLGGGDSHAFFDRRGERVALFSEETAADLHTRIAKLCSARRSPEALAVITKNSDEARRLFSALAPLVPGLKLLDREDDSYEPGLCVMPLPLAKGLEFDRVVIANSAKYRGEGDRRLLYIACTRAMHSLSVCALRRHSPFISQPRSGQERAENGADPEREGDSD